MRFLTIFILTLALSLNLDAQQGRIRVTGKITDGISGEALPGASVIIKGTTIGTISELNGDYEILVPGENVTLVYSFLGYRAQEVSLGEQQRIDIVLSQNTEELEEVMITVQARGQIGARQSQINSNTLVNVVAPDRLQENPDANAVEAIGRLPGISVKRNGGEGSGLVIRGLEPKYSSITLNGIELPSTGGDNRSTNISGISQYVLQGVEVYKALTPDMEANSVGGTVNLTLKETPSGFHSNLMLQGGYNNLNEYFGNYKLNAEASKRFFNDKLGVFLSLNAERVNRSVETMSAEYDFEDVTEQLYLHKAKLNVITRLKERRSATLSLDYRLGSTTRLKLYSLYSYSGGLTERQTKDYGITGAGSVGYQMAYNPSNTSQIMQSAFSGETNLNFLNLTIDYGVAYSISVGDDPDSRVWNWTFLRASDNSITTPENRLSYPDEVIPLFWDSSDSIKNLELVSMDRITSQLRDENLTSYLDLEVPFKVGDILSGSVKFGGKYRQKTRFRDVTNGNQVVATNQYLTAYADRDLDWLHLREDQSEIVGTNFEDYNLGTVLGGQYDFGWYYSFDRLNEFTDWWNELSEYSWNQGPGYWQDQFADLTKIGYGTNLQESVKGDQDITEHYYAGYAMAELNFGKYVMLLPGVRYEKTHAEMGGLTVYQITVPPNVMQDIGGTANTDSRDDSFILPMLHARVKPSDFLYFHMAYTQTLSRPNFNAISPNSYYNTGITPFSFITGNTQLRPEFWTNYDIQATLHNPKIGLLSLGGFYKKVEDKIWSRTYKRIKGDPIIEPFLDNHNVNVTAWENHINEVTLKGLELEWQTSFWYLPKPLNFFTLYLNYTYTHSETKYPYTTMVDIVPPEGGRPVTTRIDSVTTGPMLFQPTHIANASLGFNYKDFNAWFSFQYNGEILTGKNYNTDVKDDLKEHFYRFDLQLTYDIPVKFKGDLEILMNVANLSNYMEVRKKLYDPRPTYQEAYGWTIDLGVRYRL